MSIRTKISPLLTSLFAAFMILAGTTGAQAVPHLNVNFSDDASATIFAIPGDVFFLNGQNGIANLASGIPLAVTAIQTSESLTCCSWDDLLYQTGVNHTFTLNGVGQAFSHTWSVWDFAGPTMNLTVDGPQIYLLPEGTVSVTMDGASDFGNSTATLLFTSTAVPEPATLPLLGIGVLGVLFVRRRYSSSARSV